MSHSVQEVDTAVWGPYDDLAVVNSWLKYTEFEKSKNSMDYLTFRLKVAESPIMIKEGMLMRRGMPTLIPSTPVVRKRKSVAPLLLGRPKRGKQNSKDHALP